MSSTLPMRPGECVDVYICLASEGQLHHARGGILSSKGRYQNARNTESLVHEAFGIARFVTTVHQVPRRQMHQGSPTSRQQLQAGQCPAPQSEAARRMGIKQAFVDGMGLRS